MGKKQHFVPQFILRSFSSDVERRKLHVKLLSTGEIVQHAKLGNQGYRKYWYGKGFVEDFLANVVERKGAPLIARAIDEGLLPEAQTDDFRDLSVLVCLQIARTPGAVGRNQASMKDSLRSVFGEDPRLKAALDGVDMTFAEAGEFMIRSALTMVPMFDDLRFGLLRNTTSLPFVLADHPGVVTNPFLAMRNWEGSKHGFGNIGAVVMLPIANDTCLIAYDPVVYAFPNFGNVAHASVSDVERINRLQYCNANECVFFGNESVTAHLEQVHIDTAEYRRGAKHTTKTVKNKGSKRSGNTSEIVLSSSSDPPVDVKNFQFFGVKRKAILMDLGPFLVPVHPNVQRIRRAMGHNVPRRYPL